MELPGHEGTWVMPSFQEGEKLSIKSGLIIWVLERESEEESWKENIVLSIQLGSSGAWLALPSNPCGIKNKIQPIHNTSVAKVWGSWKGEHRNSWYLDYSSKLIPRVQTWPYISKWGLKTMTSQKTRYFLKVLCLWFFFPCDFCGLQSYTVF